MDSEDLVTITFYGTIPAFGFETFLVSVSSGTNQTTNLTSLTPGSGIPDIVLDGSEFVNVTISGSSGRLESVRSAELNSASFPLSVEQFLFWYNASDGNAESSQASGTEISEKCFFPFFFLGKKKFKKKMRLLTFRFDSIQN